MKNTITMAGALTLAATGAMAGGIERSSQSVGILFEKADNYLEFNFGAFNPSVTGVAIPAYGGTASGDMAGNYNTLSFGFKKSINDKLDFALVYDQPIGADVAYPTGTGYVVNSSTAEIKSDSLTALLRYKLPHNVSLIGGVRALRTSGVADLNILTPGPAFVPYQLRSTDETDLGYVLGVAWEKPEIAARVALTYNSSITHDFSGQETVGAGPTTTTTFSSEVPQSVNLEFQTGVAKDTLLFGSVRWVDWTAFEIAPPVYVGTVGGGSALVSYDTDVVTYTLGLGRKFNENWSAAVVYGYEKHEGGATGNLGPTDGFQSLGLAATYTRDNIKLTAGVRYVDIGDAVTRGYGSQFKDNSGWGAGLRVGYSF